MSEEVYIVSGCRTAIGNFNGQFSKLSAVKLGGVAIADAVMRASLAPSDVDEVVMGHVLTAGQGQNTARQAAVEAKIPYTTPATTVNMLCGSGLKAVHAAFLAIRGGDAGIVVAGGQESMTRARHAVYLRAGVKLGHAQCEDTLLTDGLTDAFNDVHMGNTAEHVAREYGITREEQDAFAAESQRKAQEAVENGHFYKEIAAVGNIIMDEFPKPDTTIERLASLRTVFDPNGTVTAGNSSGINDGAAALVLCSETQVKKRNLKPVAKILGFAQTGLDPMKMGLGPIDAVRKVLAKVRWNKDSVDLYELNEAFAAQSLIVLNSLQIEESKVNISGGAIALGHPIGASGARVLVTLIHNLERLGKQKGVAALCVGGGMGIAVAVQMC